MTKEHLTKLWSWLSIACVLFVAMSIISLQGGTEFVGRLFGEKAVDPIKNPAGVGYFGVIVGGGLFFLASLPFLLHVLRHGNRWHDRVPVVWLEGLDTGAWEGKVFQICVLLILVAAPVAGIVVCSRTAEMGDICEQDTKNFYEGTQTNLFFPPIAKQGNQMRLNKAGADRNDCVSGVELFPRSWTPLFFYIVPLVGFLISAFGMIFLFVPSLPALLLSKHQAPGGR